jgi:hypothetical protein
MKYFRQTLHQPQLLFTTLMLTGILFLSAGVTKARTTTANSPRNPVIAANKQHDLANLPSSIANVVLKTASQRTGLPISSLHITDSIKIEGSSSCLGLPSLPGEVCKEDLILWQVTVETGQERLVYRTNLDGSQIKLNEAVSRLISTKLPDEVASAVLLQASQRTGLPISKLRIEEFKSIQGSSSCLGIPPRPGEACTADLGPLWQVTVGGGYQHLVYHTSMDGAKIQLNQTASWNLKFLAASSLLMIVPWLVFYAYHTRARKKFLTRNVQ